MTRTNAHGQFIGDPVEGCRKRPSLSGCGRADHGRAHLLMVTLAVPPPCGTHVPDPETPATLG